jgi:hypothetical protein
MATFVSKYHNLKLIVKPTTQIIIDNRPMIQYGSSIQFENGHYDTSNKDEIFFLRNHESKGRLFYEIDNNEKDSPSKKEVKKEIKVATS